MLNVPSQAFPAAASQQRVSPAGRNKVALKPGRSLMDWIRVTKSGRDLTGLKGRLIEVTEEELRKHNTRDDCWTCIRGMVYNVSPYMEFHPGGEDELMKAAGVDGTDLFDQVHRWVNYESILKECLVGRMAVKGSTVINGLSPASSAKGLEPTPSASLLPPLPKDPHPRFDWFQTDSTVNIVVYTKRKITNSGITVVDLVGGALRVEVILGKMSYVLHLQLSHEVQELVSVLTSCAVGKVQVCVHKASSGKWAELGQPLESHDSFLRRKNRVVFYRECVLKSRTEVTHDTSLFCFKLPPATHMQMPVGKHVYLKALVQGSEVVKPYTPVERTLMPELPESKPVEGSSNEVFLMVKVYPNGVFTPHLNSLNIGDSLLMSSPEGSFSLRPLHDITHLYLLAAGTGFTPMARLIKFALQNLGTLRKVRLMFFNRQEKDILWHFDLDRLAAQEERFEVDYVLSEPSDDWPGRRGQIEASLLSDFLTKQEESKCFVCICGPTAFTELALRLVQQMGYLNEEVHAFQG
ncbi:cytochrome b5 reductase 4 [Scleropages formosus]|nr:cytochrome b5 reductase 4 [Scleropages formosus]